VQTQVGTGHGSRDPADDAVLGAIPLIGYSRTLRCVEESESIVSQPCASNGRLRYSAMISDTTLTNLSNGLGVTAMLLIVAYHFVAVNGKRMEQ
jgi:hypothetical protein